MLKNCLICGKMFNAKTSDNTCSEFCRIERKRITDNLKATKYRNNHKHEEEYKRKKEEQRIFIETKCLNCGKDIKIEKYKKKYTEFCTDCFQKTRIKNIKMQSKKKQKSNTSGFIGVYIHLKEWNRNEVWGVTSKISDSRKNIFYKRYKDDMATKKTLIEAAIDRELFIIENNLPHTRNFTDEELKSHLQYLGR